MELENILKNKEEFYLFAVEHYYNIDEDYLNDIDEIVTKSISILLDHEFIPTPCIEIRLEIHYKNNDRSSYYLYVDEKKEFLDDFFITH